LIDFWSPDRRKVTDQGDPPGRRRGFESQNEAGYDGYGIGPESTGLVPDEFLQRLEMVGRPTPRTRK